MKTPTNLQHKPIIVIDDYDQMDGKFANGTDAMALSIGLAQWENQDNDISAKVFRRKNEKWLRQSEELPPHRVLDLSILFITSIIKSSNNINPLSDLKGKIINANELNKIQDYYTSNREDLDSRIKELEKVINLFNNK